MQRVAFKMKLLKGYEQEYKKRHDEIWSDLKDLLKQSGIVDYSIFLDKQSNDLFGYLTIENMKKLDLLPKEPVMKKRWSYMKDIMETNDDNSPVTIPLEEVFYLP
jgi:L-rhamnose mutarotase